MKPVIPSVTTVLQALPALVGTAAIWWSEMAAYVPIASRQEQAGAASRTQNQ